MRLQVLARWSPAGLAVAVWLAVMASNSVSLRDMLTYGVYLVAGILVPGMLVARSLFGRTPILIADLSVGAVVGLLLQLVFWAVAVGTGHGSLMRWLPGVVYLTYAAVPGLRRHWRPLHSDPVLMPPVAAWLLSLSTMAVSAWFTGFFAMTRPVRGWIQWPFDMYWFLGTVELLKRQVSPEDSQVAGHHLAYHWFATADIAAASLATGIDPATVITRLWVLPIVALTLGMLVAVLQELSPRGALMGALAAVLLVAPAGIEVVPWLDVPWDTTFAPASPSQNYSYPFLLFSLFLIIRYLRTGQGRLLAPTALVLVLGPGIKATNLPIVLSGLMLAVAVCVLGRGPWRRPATLLALTVAALAVGTVAIGAGGSAGAGVQLLSTLRRNPVYYEFIGKTAREASLPGPFLPSGLGANEATLILVLLLLAVLLKYLWVVPGVVVLRRHSAQTSVVGWLLFGGGLAGWLLMLLVDQSGLSQVYFLSSGVVLWVVLAAWGAIVLWDRARTTASEIAALRWVVAGALAALLVSRVASRFSARRPAEDLTLSGLVIALFPVLALVVAGAVVVAVKGMRRARDGTAWLVTFVAGLMCAAVVTNPLPSITATPPRVPSGQSVTAEESSAARWVAQHAAPHDVVATNVHCLTGRTRPGCDARAFWVSALTRRRVFIGGWGYLDESRSRAGAAGLPATQQPFYSEQEFRLNESLFTQPTRQVADQLSRRGVVWVFADRRRGKVSPRLGDVATLVHSNAGVEVFRLRRPGATTSG